MWNQAVLPDEKDLQVLLSQLNFTNAETVNKHISFFPQCK